MGLAMHGSEALFAAALIDGRVLVSGYGRDGLASKHDIQLWPEQSARAVAFSPGSQLLLVGSADAELAHVDVATGAAVQRLSAAHEHPITCAEVVGEEGLVAVGDEGGCVRLWDPRDPGRRPARSWEPHADYVSDLTWSAARASLLSVSGDGRLARMDPRLGKVQERSEEDVDDELLSVAVVKQGRKIVCGTTTGVVNIWSWGYWNDCSDRLTGHPESTEAIVKLDEDTIVTGSSDGMLRVCSVQPNRLLGVLGAHADYPIEHLALSGDGAVLASASHDQTVKLWDLEAEGEGEAEEAEGKEASEEAHEEANAGAGAAQPADDAPSSDSDDSDSDDDRRPQRKGKRRGKKEKTAGQPKGKRRNTFFDGLT
ncbi:hypothetical protein QBZ16_001526 [Prototheca wickerhamii]|uniref:Uncharacterized protein n=1 Tax=Prototheca wickerhamii TaxID=3111 RepID=A0AAD9IFP0_PROWI|nr:hypothetical protein QBZ16_001526 [Prototheca wickerhamii]